MAILRAFKGLLPPKNKAAEVAAVPYDVVSTEEAAKLANGNMLSFLRISRPEIELEKGIDLHDEKVYAKAAENFKRLVDSAPLTFNKEPHVYIYTLKMGNHIQTGIAATFSVDEYNKGIIKKHEKTRTDKEDDRTRHILGLRSQTGPVFLAYRDVKAVDELVEKVKTLAPLFDFTAPDKIQHTFWRADIKTSAELSKLFRNIPCLYIADGHHRAAAAARTAAECGKKNPNHTGDEEYNYFLAVTFPATQLRILPYNRIVKDLNGLGNAEFIRKISADFEISDTKNPSPSKPGEICFLLDGKWRKMTPKFKIYELGVIDQLDVSILQKKVLAPILGIDDPRTSRRIDFIGGIRGTGELEKHVKNGSAAVAFSMFPTTLDQLMAIADAGEIMPPKSTWFEPKLRDGMVCHSF